MNNVIMRLTLLLFFVFIGLKAQNKKEKKVKIDGNLSLFYDMYNYNTANYNTFRPRYEDNIVRFVANANLKLGKHFSIPFGINVSNQKTSYNIPQLPEENLFNYIQNPKNNIHIDPKYKWIEGHIGSYTPNYSTLTTGDIQIFGAGLDINPKKFILSGSYGKSQIAIEPDTSLNIQGAYKQNIFGGRIGYGKIEGTKFVINFVKIKDDVNSVISQPLGIKPIEGLTISPLFEFKIAKKLTVKTETAASIYTEDLLSPFNLDNQIVDKVSDYITLNASSKADLAHVSSLEWKSKNFLLGGEIKYIGPGFMPVGYRNIERDIIDYKLNTGFKMFKNKLNLKGTFGIRTNNIQNTTLDTTKRIISNANIFAQISDAFSVNASYANFGFRNNPNDDTLRIEMINNSFSISPNYQIKSKILQHQISATASINNFKQYDTTILDFVDTKSNTYNANYMVIFRNIPLNIGLTGLYLENLSSVGNLKLTTYGLNAGYRLLKKKLKPSISVNLANIKRGVFTQDNRLNIKFKLKYKINKKLRFNFTYKYDNNKYGSSRPGAILNENKIQFAILKKL